MNKIVNLFTVVVMVVFFSCSKKKAEPAAITTSTSTTSSTNTTSTTATTSTTSTASISYSKNVVPILSNNCYSCHSTANSSLGGGFALDTYSGFKMFSKSFCINCLIINE